MKQTRLKYGSYNSIYVDLFRSAVYESNNENFLNFIDQQKNNKIERPTLREGQKNFVNPRTSKKRFTNEKKYAKSFFPF